MKKLFTLLSFLLVVFTVKAQNFHPFPPDYTYQFSYAGGDSLYIIKADSVSESGEVFFNPLYIVPNIETPDSNNVFWKKLIPIEDEYVFVSVEKDTLFLKPGVPLNSEFKFTEGIQATVTSKQEEEFLGVSDFVVTFDLSTGETVKLSENHGFVQSYNFADIGKEGSLPYVLSAIPEAGLGDYFWDPLVLYDYEVGDVLGYTQLKGPLVGPPDDRRTIVKEVLEKEIRDDSVIYVFKVKTKVYANEWNGTEEATFTEEVREAYQREETVVVPTFGFFKEPDECCNFGSVNLGVKLSDMGMKSSFDGPYTLLEDGFLSGVIGNTQGRADYVEKLGEVNNYSYYSNNKLLLVCYNTASAGSYGNCDSLMSVVTSTTNKKVAQQISLAPNPAKDYINVSVPEKVSYQIINTSGTVVKEGILYKDAPLSVESLETGLYMINLTSDSNIYQQRFVKK